VDRGHFRDWFTVLRLGQHSLTGAGTGARNVIGYGGHQLHAYELPASYCGRECDVYPSDRYRVHHFISGDTIPGNPETENLNAKRRTP
jgi:hypothetical protein